MDDYTIKKDYSMSEKMMKSIIDVVKDSGYKEIYYSGTCNGKLVINLSKMEGTKIYLLLWSYCEETYSTVKYYDDEKKCYIKKEDFNEDTTWVSAAHENIMLLGEGLPRHDILLLDAGYREEHYIHNGHSMFSDDDYFGKRGIARIVILFGQANMESFYDRNFYIWRNVGDNVLVGVLRSGVEVVDYDKIVYNY